METRIREINISKWDTALSDEWNYEANYNFIDEVGGDFNIIAEVNESFYCDLGSYSSSDMDDLQDWILDFPVSFAEYKAPGVSDHCLGIIWTQKEARIHKPKPFKFFNCWTTSENFLSSVKASWLQHCDSNAMQVMFCKLKRLKPILKDLNRTQFSDISSRVAAKRAELEHIQLANLDATNQAGIEEEEKLQVVLVDLEMAELDFYRQRAKVHWLQEDDLSKKFFYQKS
ncbi:uncharacterized protein LOC120184262 [Hibiscus syriacus]|uniref:uncharacterized protein LOC120184262 n=1 Tax=Hibiscus syriacus TaxID=106335 RepID=UPI0019204716|nr:uncharacterized protein LOC120184262 [Hibiscus syriacus]